MLAKNKFCKKCGKRITYAFSARQQYCVNCYNEKGNNLLKDGYNEEMLIKEIPEKIVKKEIKKKSWAGNVKKSAAGWRSCGS